MSLSFTVLHVRCLHGMTLDSIMTPESNAGGRWELTTTVRVCSAETSNRSSVSACKTQVLVSTFESVPEVAISVTQVPSSPCRKCALGFYKLTAEHVLPQVSPLYHPKKTTLWLYDHDFFHQISFVVESTRHRRHDTPVCSGISPAVSVHLFLNLDPQDSKQIDPLRLTVR